METALIFETASLGRRVLTELAVEIGNQFAADVCSFYLVDDQSRELVLAATVGLRQASVGKVRMPFSEGLVGLVAESARPQMVSDAQLHSRFKYFEEAGEEPYDSFLGIPIVDDGVVVGVLTIQTVESEVFPAQFQTRLVSVADSLVNILRHVRKIANEEQQPPSISSDRSPARHHRKLTFAVLDVLMALRPGGVILPDGRGDSPETDGLVAEASRIIGACYLEP